MKVFFILISIFSLSCSINDSSQEFELSTEFLEGKWVRTQFDDTFNMVKVQDDSVSLNIQFIEYQFIDNSFSSCRILNSEHPSDFYEYCRWNLYGEYPDYFLSIEYKIKDNPYNETQSFLYLVKNRSENSIKLRTIRQSF